MDIGDFVFGFFLVICGILIFALVTLGIYAAVKEINRDDNTNKYQKCICEKVD